MTTESRLLAERMSLLQDVKINARNLQKQRRAMHGRTGPGMPLRVILFCAKKFEYEYTDPLTKAKMKGNGIRFMVLPLWPKEVETLKKEHFAENAGVFLPDNLCYRLYEYILEGDDRNDDVFGVGGAAPAAQGGQANQKKKSKKVTLLEDRYFDIYLGRVTEIAMFPDSKDIEEDKVYLGMCMKTRYERAKVGKKPDCDQSKPETAFNCGTVVIEKKLPMGAVYNAFSSLPSSSLMVPNPHVFPSYYSYKAILHYNPLRSVDAIGEKDVDKMAGAIHVLSGMYNKPPDPSKRLKQGDWLGIEIQGTVLQFSNAAKPWELRGPLLTGSGFSERIAVESNLRTEDMIAMFGLSDEQRFGACVYRVALVAPAFIMCTPNTKKTSGVQFNAQQHEAAEGGIIYWSHGCIHPGRWLLERATIPVTVDFVAEAAAKAESAAKGEASAMFMNKAYKNADCKFTRQGASIACLTALGVRSLSFYMDSVARGLGTFRVIPSVVILPRDVASGRFYDMTPEQGTGYLKAAATDDPSGERLYVLYYFARLSDEQRAAKEKKNADVLAQLLAEWSRFM